MTTPPPPPLPPVPFTFTGSGREYFRIWIVNVLLSVLTLGIYSAWAKVRRKRYFHGNTRLAGNSFGYHANPRKILRGRLILAAIFILYVLSAIHWPDFEQLLGMALFLATPLVVIKALGFNARNTSFRNIRFGFQPNFTEAATIFLSGAILPLITLGIGYPYYLHMKKRFMVHLSRYGDTHFELETETAQFYRAFTIPSLFSVVGIIFIFFLFDWVYPLSQVFALKSQDPDFFQDFLTHFGASLFLFSFFLFIAVRALIKTQVDNLVFNNLTLGKHRFRSTLISSDMVWLHVTNTAAMLLTFGLFAPWAKVRLLRYQLANLQLLPAEALTISSYEEGEMDALSSEAGEFLDMDLGL